MATIPLPPPETIKVYRQRRTQLTHLLRGHPALISAGQPRIGNFPANHCAPFRALSSFLYLVGTSIPHGELLFNDSGATLFCEGPDPDDALWHGPRPDLEALSEALGCSVRPLNELSEALGKERPLTLPSFEPGLRQSLTRLLGATPTAVESDPLVEALVELRLCHDSLAAEELAQAATLSAAAHRRGMAVTHPGISASLVRAEMEALFMARGARCAYQPIVTPAGEVLHNHSYDETLSAGDLLLADVGAETGRGWAGDITRTWPVSGTFSESQRAIYAVVLRAQERAIEALRPGVWYEEIHQLTCLSLAEGLRDLGIFTSVSPEALVDANAHALFFPHGVGHLIGLDVHDMEAFGDRAGYPNDRSRSDRFGGSFLRLNRPLEVGMAVTVEPGFYQIPALLEAPERVGPEVRRLVRWEKLREFRDVRGIRIEDDLLIQEGPALNMSADVPKKIPEIEALVGTARSAFA